MIAHHGTRRPTGPGFVSCPLAGDAVWRLQTEGRRKANAKRLPICRRSRRLRRVRTSWTGAGNCLIPRFLPRKDSLYRLAAALARHDLSPAGACRQRLTLWSRSQPAEPLL